jgi:hypothetical protein
LYELNKIRTEQVKPEELQQVKNILTGNFARSLENPQTIARFALNTAKYNLPSDYYENYLANIQATTPQEVLATAQKYITPNNAHIMVVGDKKIADKLAQFGTISYYDAQGNPAQPQAELPKDLTAKKVIDSYIAAVGGENNIKKIKSLTTQLTADVQGSELTINRTYKAPNLFKEDVKVKIMTLQSRIYNGTEGFEKSMGSPDATPKGEELDELKFDAYIVPEIYLDAMGAKIELIGTEKVNDQPAYILQTTFVGGKIHTDYFATNNGLKLRSTQTSPNPDGSTTSSITDFGDYTDVAGIKIPHTITQTVGGQKIKATIKNIKANEKIKASAFTIKK